MDNREVETHPSYGVVKFTRVGGGKNHLFGSSLPYHYGYIEIQVSTARQIKEIGRFECYDDKNIVRAKLSAAQFAELLTTMNHGCGTACTIDYLGGERIEGPKFVETESEYTKRKTEDLLNEFHQQDLELAEYVLEKLSAKGAFVKADRAKAASLIQSLLRGSGAGTVSHALDYYRKSVERVKTAAKAEVDAAVTFMVQKAGLESLKGKLLGKGTENE